MCESSCYSCLALHRRAGPLAPRDNHSLAEGYQFCPNLSSSPPESFQSIPLLYMFAATRQCACYSSNARGKHCRSNVREQRTPVCSFFFFECLKFVILVTSREQAWDIYLYNFLYISSFPLSYMP